MYLTNVTRGTREVEYVPLGYARFEVTKKGEVLLTNMHRWMCKPGYMVYLIEALRSLIPEPFTLKVHAASGTTCAYNRMGFQTDKTDNSYSHVMKMDWNQYNCAIDSAIPVTEYVTTKTYDLSRYHFVNRTNSPARTPGLL